MAWTGGQYSVYRAVFGAYLFFHFLRLIPWGPELFSNAGVLADGYLSPLMHLFPNVLAVWDGPAFVQFLLGIAAGLSVLFALGWHDRVAAVLLWYIWACLHTRMPLIANPGMPYIGWLLLAHACMPPAPYLSLEARGRVDPDGGWRMNTGIWLAAWILLAVGYSYSGLTKLGSPSWLDGSALARVLENPLARPGWPRDLLLSLPKAMLYGFTWIALALEIGFAPLALFRRTRPWIWTAMLAMHLALMLVVDFADLSFGMLIVHFFTFDPAWVPPRNPNVTETVFYDGNCGLCHRAVRFALAEDRAGTAFRFAPLDSSAFRTSVSDADRRSLPDSIIVKTAGGELLMRSAAVFHILGRLGGLWRILSAVCGVIPRPIRDFFYDGVARVRKRIFAPPATACPILPPHLRGRFAID